MMSNLRLPRLRRAKALPHRIQSSVDVSRLAVALPAVSVTKVDVSRSAGRSPGYSVPGKIPSPFSSVAARPRLDSPDQMGRAKSWHWDHYHKGDERLMGHIGRPTASIVSNMNMTDSSL